MFRFNERRTVLRTMTLVVCLIVTMSMLMPETALAGTTTKKDSYGNTQAVTTTYQAGSKLTMKGTGSNWKKVGSDTAVEEGDLGFTLIGAEISGPNGYYKLGPSKDGQASTVQLGAPGKYTIQTDFLMHLYDGTWNSEGTVPIVTTINVKGKVNYHGNGGKVGKISKRWYSVGEPLKTLPNAKRKARKFLGWYTAKTGGKQVTKATKPQFGKKTNVTYYARWGQKVNVVFKGNKGKVSKKKVPFWTNVQYGNKLPKAKRKGYTFAGWYTKKSGGKNVTAKTIVPDRNKITLYAHWKKKSKSSSKMVYVTATGTRYHVKKKCWGLRKAKTTHKTTLAEALSEGYTPCKVCVH